MLELTHFRVIEENFSSTRTIQGHVMLQTDTIVDWMTLIGHYLESGPLPKYVVEENKLGWGQNKHHIASY